MPIDIGGYYTLSGVNGSTAFKISTSTKDISTINTSGATKTPYQVGFQAGNASDSGWYYLAPTIGSNYYIFTFANVINNNGSGFSTSTSRFTAPVTGMYLFHATSYFLKDVSGSSAYCYLCFSKNGAGNYQGIVLRGYEYPSSNYFHGELTSHLYLNAGDYVVYSAQIVASNSSSLRHYPYYSHFEGYLVG